MSGKTIQDKIDVGSALKTEGNSLFKDKQYKKAIFSYAKVFAYVNGIVSSSDKLAMYTSSLGQETPTELQLELINSLKIASWSNMAACYLKLEKYDKAIENCANIIKVQEKHAKANFRMGEAYFALTEYEKALKYFTIASETDETNMSMQNKKKKTQMLISQQNKASEEKAKKTFSQAFQNSSKNGLFSV